MNLSMGAPPNELAGQRFPASQRRSQRLLLKVGILVRGTRPDGKPFSEKAFTSVVSAHGALVLLREPVQAGQQISITHVSANEESAFRVVELYGAHAETGTTQVGV